MARRVGHNSLWLIGQPLLANVLSIASNSYIARRLGAVDYGAFNLGYAQIALFSPLCNLGLRAVAVRAVAEDRGHAREVVAAVAALRMLFTAGAGALALCWLAAAPYGPVTRAIGLAAIASMVMQSTGYVAVDLFNGFERARLAAQPVMIGGLTLTLLSVAALAAGLGLPGFVAAYLVGHAVQLSLLLRAAGGQFFPVRPAWDGERIRQMLRQARPFALLSVLSSITDAPVLDILILGALYGDASVGPYAAAIGLVGRLLMVPLGLADAAYPAVAGGYREDRAAVEHTVRRCVLNLLVVTTPIALGLTFAAPTALWILFGDQYTSAADALRVAAWLLPLGGLSYLVRQCLAAVHRQDQVVRLSLAGGVLLVALFALLIPTLGPLGAAVAGVSRELLMLGPWMRALGAAFDGPAPRDGLGRVAAALACMAVPLAVAAWVNTHPAAILGGTAGLAAYGAAAAVLGLAAPLPVRALLRRRALSRSAAPGRQAGEPAPPDG